VSKFLFSSVKFLRDVIYLFIKARSGARHLRPTTNKELLL